MSRLTKRVVASAKRLRRGPATRHEAVQRERKRLETQGWPRLQMSALVLLTGGVGLLSSVLMLRAGLESMAWRYPLALGVAYLGFIGLLWLWLRTRAEDWADLPNPLDVLPTRGSSGSCTPSIRSGGGGDFGGGGAQASFDMAPTSLPMPQPALSSSSASTPAVPESVGDAVGTVADADELAIPIAVLVFALALLFASFYVVYLAPVLFAEILVDAGLTYGLYRRLHGTDPAHWLETAIRRTALPFIATALVVAGVGWALGHYAPGARSLGEAWERVR